MNPTQAQALRDLARDLKLSQKIRTGLDAAIADPPRTTEEVGFYLGGEENDFENVWRWLVSQIMGTRWCFEAEDKYSHELFVEIRDALGGLPPEVVRLLPELFDPDFDGDVGSEPGAAEARGAQLAADFPAAAAALEAAFAKKGRPLVSLDIAGGDTLVFLAHKGADRWRDVQLGETCSGEPLGVRSPLWDDLFAHLEYAMGVRGTVRMSRPDWRPLSS